MSQNNPQVSIKENSVFARIAAWKLGASSMAITFGNTIHLYKSSSKDLLMNERWLRHELKHVEQYKKLGFFTFIIKYVWWSIKYGYYNNPLEIEARLAEADEFIAKKFDIIA